MTCLQLRQLLSDVVNQATDVPSVTSPALTKREVWHRLARATRSRAHEECRDSDRVNQLYIDTFNREFKL